MYICCTLVAILKSSFSEQNAQLENVTSGWLRYHTMVHAEDFTCGFGKLPGLGSSNRLSKYTLKSKQVNRSTISLRKSTAHNPVHGLYLRFQESRPTSNVDPKKDVLTLIDKVIQLLLLSSEFTE